MVNFKYLKVVILVLSYIYINCAEKKDYKKTPKILSELINRNDVEGVKTYLDKNPEDINSMDEIGTPLMDAILVDDPTADNTPLILELLRRTKDIDTRNNLGFTALNDLVFLKPDLQLVREFIKRKAEINSKANNGKTVLMSAAASREPKYFDQQLQVIKLLLDNGADINEVDENGENAFLWSIESANLPVVQFFLDNSKKKFDINFKGKNLHNALFKVLDIFRNLKYSENYTDKEKSLYKKNLEDITHMLISRGININERDINNNTAFLNASSDCDLQIVKLLAKYNPDFKAVYDPTINEALLFAEYNLTSTGIIKTKDEIDECEKVVAFLKQMDPNYKLTEEFKEKEFAKKAQKEISRVLPAQLSEIVSKFGAGHEESSLVKMDKIKKAIRESNQKELSKILNTNKYNIILTDEAGDTPLMIAIKLNKISAISLILNKLRSLDRSEKTEITKTKKVTKEITKEKCPGCGQYHDLEEKHASNWLVGQLNARNKNKQTVYDIANIIGNKEIIKLLPKIK